MTRHSDTPNAHFHFAINGGSGGEGQTNRVDDNKITFEQL